jgi:ribonuclease HII
MSQQQVVGVDEVGRGAWAGPVVVGAAWGARAACERILADGNGGFRDSKSLTPRARGQLRAALLAAGMGAAVGVASPQEVDEHGLAGALTLAAERALAGIEVALVLLDGRHPYVRAPRVECVVEGDRRCALIAAASIVAKLHRDAMMETLEAVLPGYGFATHKGYGTSRHREALAQLGPSAQHRLSVEPVAALQHRRTQPLWERT